MASAWSWILADRSASATAAQPLRGRSSADRHVHHHRRDLVAEPVVAVVIRSDGNEHRHVAALRHLGPRRQEVVHAAGDGRQQEIVQGHPEVVFRPVQAIQRLAHDDGPAVEADAGIERAGGRGHGLGEQTGERGGVVRHDVRRPGTDAAGRSTRPPGPATPARRGAPARPRPRPAWAGRGPAPSCRGCVGPAGGVRGRGGPSPARRPRGRRPWRGGASRRARRDHPGARRSTTCPTGAGCDRAGRTSARRRRPGAGHRPRAPVSAAWCT